MLKKERASLARENGTEDKPRQNAPMGQLLEIVNGMTEACFALDAEWRFTFVNDRGLRLLHHSREEMIGRTIWEVFWQLNGTPMEQHYRRAMRERAPVAFEAWSPVAEHWVHIRLFPSGDGLAAFLMDVDERKKAEIKVSSVFANNPAAIVISRLEDGLVLEANDAWVDLTGFSRGETVAQPKHGIWTDQDARDRFLTALKQSGTVRGREEEFRKKSGDSFVAEVSAQIISAGDEQVLLSTLVDITERRRVEARLRAREEQFRSLVALLPDAVLIRQRDRLVYVNGKGLELWKATDLAQLAGRPMMTLWHPDSHPAIRERINRLLNDGGVNLPTALKLVALDGTVLDVETVASVVEYEGAPAIQVVIRDITEQKRLGLARERQQRRVTLLGDISRRLVMSESPRQLLEGIFSDVAREVGVDIFANYMVAPDGSRLLLESSGGLTEAQRKDFAHLPFGVSLCGLVAQRRERLVFADLPSSVLPQAVGIIALGVRAYAGHPLIAGERLIGTISFGSRGQEKFEEEDVRLMKAVADQVAAALERSRLQAAVGESEERFRTLVALSPDAVYIHQANRVVYMNQQGLRLWRAKNEAEVIGLEPLELIHPDSRELVRDRIRHALEDRLALPRQELKILTRDGVAIDVETTEAGFEFQGVKAVQVLVRDITDRKRAEAALRMSEAKFSQAFANNAAAIAITRLADGVALDVNDTWVRLCGYSREEILGRSARMTWADENAVARFLNQLRATGEVRGWEQEFRRKSGEVFTAELWTKRLELEGEPVILSTLVDITARRQAEEALRTHKEILEETGRIAKVGGWDFDAITGEGFWTDEVARIHDLDPSTPTSRDIGFSYYVESSRPKIEAAVKAAVEHAQPYDLELELRTAKGVRKWVHTIGRPVVENGRVVRVRGSFQDITAQKKLEEQFLRSQRLEAIGTLSSGIAHDLNNILAPVLMIAPMLKDKLTDPLDAEMADVISQSMQRGASIIRQLLTFSRGVEGERGPVHLQHIVREMRGLMQETFPREITIEVDVQQPLWPVIGDATQLHQVLMNLCVNARDAMPTGGTLTIGARNVMLSAEEAAEHPSAVPGPHVLVTVADTGAGIPRENLDRIFEPFFTTKEIGKGTGLGLSTTLGIIKSFGGFIEVRSEVGHGTVFEIHLPADSSQLETVVGKNRPAPRGRGECILVVDDESAIRTVLRRTLEGAGYRVLIAVDGRDGAELFMQHRADVQLLLTDLMMPRMDGVALVRALRKLAPKLKVIAMTGLEDKERQKALTDLGVTELLAKPCQPSVILEALHRQLGAAGA